ncbi:hypothetical protein THAOC_10083, partial [Thalassiosira oceanica]
VPAGELLREIGPAALQGMSQESHPAVGMSVLAMVHDSLLSPGGLLDWDDASRAHEVVPPDLVRPTVQLLYQFFMNAKKAEYNTPAREAMAKVMELVDAFGLEKELTGQFAPDCFRLQHATLMEKYPADEIEEGAMLRDFRDDMRRMARRKAGSFRLDPTVYENSYEFCSFSTFYLSLHYDAGMREGLSYHAEVIRRAWPHIDEPLRPELDLRTAARGKGGPGVIRLGVASGCFFDEAHPVPSDFGGVLDRLPNAARMDPASLLDAASNGTAVFEIIYIYFDEGQRANRVAWLANRRYTPVVGTGATSADGLDPSTNFLHLKKGPSQVDYVRTAQESIAGLQLDVLFYLDLTMSKFAHLVASGTRLAPAQGVSHGHPTTSGIGPSKMDYYVSWGAAELPTAHEHYTEGELLLLPADSMHQYYVPRVSPDARASMVDMTEFMDAASARREFLAAHSLPGTATLYLCMQKPHKYSPAFDGMLAGVHRADPNAILVLHRVDQDGEHNHARFTDRLVRAGVDLDRVAFLPTQPHSLLMALYSLADVVLDSYHAGGCTTTREAFEVGALVVTLPAQYLGSRWSLAYYSIMGVTDLVAETREEYVDIAVRMATDKAAAEEVRVRIVENRHKLFRREEAVEAWMDVYKTMAAGGVRREGTEENEGEREDNNTTINDEL